jgi:hypothetical protein
MEKVDRKFVILAVNPVTGKIYTEADGLFFCAKDAAVPAMLEAYREETRKRGSNPEHVNSIELARQRVIKYQEEMGGGRVADTVGDEIPRCLFGEGLAERR